MLPRIQAEDRTEFVFCRSKIEDLYFDGTTDASKDMTKLQSVFQKSKSQDILRKHYAATFMNRHGFQEFAMKACGVDADVADEIFSCSTDAFAEENDIDELPPDKEMTHGEFSVGVIRLANLWTLMNEGMANGSQLASQTSHLFQVMESN